MYSRRQPHVILSDEELSALFKPDGNAYGADLLDRPFRFKDLKPVDVEQIQAQSALALDLFRSSQKTM